MTLQLLKEINETHYAHQLRLMHKIDDSDIIFALKVNKC